MGKLSVQPLEALQYFYSAAHEPAMRCMITFLGHIDETILKKAVNLSARTAPIIKCGFETTKNRPRWRYTGLTADDIVQMVKADPKAKQQPEKLAVSVIDFFSGPQTKIYILRNQTSDTLIIIMNHMVCDGVGFKEYLYLLARLYTALYNNSDYTEKFEPTQRSLAPLLHSLTLKDKMKIFFSKPELEKQKNNIVIPFEGDTSSPFIETHCLPREVLGDIKAYAQKNHATLNDVFLTAYIRIINRETGSKRVILPCPVDLRKFIPRSKQPGICNLTSNLICDVTLEQGESFVQTLNKVSCEMKHQKSSHSCVKPVMVLTIAYRMFTFAYLKKLFSKSFTIPVVSYTNLGKIEKNRLGFGKTAITNAVMTGAVKYVPYFQITVSSFDEICTLSCNMYGTGNDRDRIKSLLKLFEKEILSNIAV